MTQQQWQQRKKTASSIVIAGGQEKEEAATPMIKEANAVLEAQETVNDEPKEASLTEIEPEQVVSESEDDGLDLSAIEDEVEAEKSEEAEEEPVLKGKKHEPLPDHVQHAIDKRIAKEVAKRKAAEEEAKRLREDFRNDRAATLPPEFHQIVGDEWVIRPDTKEKIEMPKAANYNGDVAQYMEDMAKFNNVRQRVIHAVTSYHQKQMSEQNQLQRVEDGYQPRLQRAMEKYPDFAQAVSSPEQAAFEQAHKWVVPLLKESEYGTEIVYRLSKHKDLLRQLTSMTPAQVAKEIGKLEALEEMAVKPRAASSAPKPIGTSSKLGGVVSGDLRAKTFEDMSIGDLKTRLRQTNRRR